MCASGLKRSGRTSEKDNGDRRDRGGRFFPDCTDARRCEQCLTPRLLLIRVLNLLYYSSEARYFHVAHSCSSAVMARCVRPSPPSRGALVFLFSSFSVLIFPAPSAVVRVEYKRADNARARLHRAGFIVAARAGEAIKVRYNLLPPVGENVSRGNVARISRIRIYVRCELKKKQKEKDGLIMRPLK